jgi:hypothetical protein
MGIFWSILFKILLYLALIGIIHTCVIYTQNTFTQPKKRIVATDQLLYEAVEEKLKESVQLDVKTPPHNGELISTTSIDSIPMDGGGVSGVSGVGGVGGISVESIIPNETNMKDQLKNFLKNSGNPPSV